MWDLLGRSHILQKLREKEMIIEVGFDVPNNEWEAFEEDLLNQNYPFYIESTGKYSSLDELETYCEEK